MTNKICSGNTRVITATFMVENIQWRFVPMSSGAVVAYLTKLFVNLIEVKNEDLL